VADRPYLALLRALGHAGVRYAIGGGFAVVLHGVPRMTFDLDLVVDLTDSNMAVLVQTLEREGYRPRLPVPLAELADAARRRTWTEERNLVAFTLHHPDRPMEEVDILLAPGVEWSDVDATLVRRTIEGATVHVVGRALLRRMKLATGRAQDRVDAEHLAALEDGDG
jgi:hypothetical protein